MSCQVCGSTDPHDHPPAGSPAKDAHHTHLRADYPWRGWRLNQPKKNPVEVRWVEPK